MPRQVHLEIPKSPAKTTRLTISLPTEQFDNLVYVSQRMGISRSAVLAQLLDGALSHLRNLVSCVPEGPEDYSVARYRGDSKEIIRTRLQGLMADLDKE